MGWVEHTVEQKKSGGLFVGNDKEDGLKCQNPLIIRRWDRKDLLRLDRTCYVRLKEYLRTKDTQRREDGVVNRSRSDRVFVPRRCVVLAPPRQRRVCTT